MSTQKEGRTQERSGPETAGLLVADRAGQILFCNGDAEKLLDKSADEFCIMTFIRCCPSWRSGRAATCTRAAAAVCCGSGCPCRPGLRPTRRSASC